MTKVLTVLVAAEHVENLDDTYTITLAETDYSFPTIAVMPDLMWMRR